MTTMTRRTALGGLGSLVGLGLASALTRGPVDAKKHKHKGKKKHKQGGKGTGGGNPPGGNPNSGGTLPVRC